MVSINNNASGHTCFTLDWYAGADGCNAGTKKTVYFWRLFNENEAMVRDALDLIRRTSVGQTKCNVCFQRLGSTSWFGRSGGRSFDDTFNDPEIWISYHWDISTNIFGFTSTSSRGKEITIAQNAFNLGLRTVAATLVHELAHVNGAPGRASHAAENTLPECGFSDQFNPNTVGINGNEPPPTVLYRPC